MKIGNLQFDNSVFLAPMAGVTTSAFRRICLEMDCGMVVTEMVSAKGLYYGSENTEMLLNTDKNERPVAVQIFGRDPKIMAEAAEYFNARKEFCILDINMGCPAPKIVNNGEGSALMKEPKLAAEIVREIKKVSNKPVTVKFRMGFDNSSINAVEFAKAMEAAGADAIAVHGRTRAQMYEGIANWDIIEKVKKAVYIPVIGNGDVFSAEDAKRIKTTTNCDGILVARGAMGNPWIFREINQALSGKDIIVKSDEEKLDTCMRHLKMEVENLGEFKAVREMRKQIAWYLKGLKGCTEIKIMINSETSLNGMLNILNQYKEKLTRL